MPHDSLTSRLRGYVAEILSGRMAIRHVSRRKRSDWQLGTSMVEVNTLEQRILLAAPNYDFGDAPYPYPVTLAENGARHLGTGPTLGATRDSENDGSHSATGSADGVDEDGVTVGTIRVGQLDCKVTVNVQNAPSGARLDAWIDFNHDGNWGGSFEQIARNVALVNGNNTVSFDVPGWAVDGQTFGRFRLSTAGSFGMSGPAGDGEVEDYEISILPSALSAGEFSAERTITGNTYSVESVFAADVDGDGDMDVLSASEVITWYENTGAGRFTSHQIAAVPGIYQSVFAMDFDGDGDVDVLSNNLKWYENDGNESFTERSISTTVTWAYAISAADIDGDGDTDVVAELGTAGIIWFENNGGQSFTAKQVTAVSNTTRSVVAVDMDRDGDLDVLCGTRTWYENDGSQNFVERTLSAETSQWVWAADMDDDGDMDVVSIRTFVENQQYRGSVTWYENDGTQVFSARIISTGFRMPDSVMVADMDGDRHMDVLVSFATPFPGAPYVPKMIILYMNDGSQNFTAGTIVSSSYASVNAIFAADVDGDGDLDTISGGRDPEKVVWYENLNDVDFDFGDAPSSYPVLLSEDGARHRIAGPGLGSGPRLGATRDPESDGSHSALADADDTMGVLDDEDGVKFSAILSGSTASSLTVTASGPGKIDAWLDVNEDGDWLDAGEKIIDGVNVVQGENRLEFNTPVVPDSGFLFARIRLSTAGGLDVTGAAADGEVEDYRRPVQLVSPVITGPATPTGALRPTLTWTAVAAATTYKVNVTNLSTNTTNYHVATVSGTSYTPSVDFGIGLYSYTVQAFGTPESDSSWPSRAFTFQIQAPVTGLRVVSVDTTLRPTLVWNLQPGAVRYDIWIDNLTRNEVQVVRKSNLTINLFSPNVNLAYGSYRAWVRGIDATGTHPGGWSAALDFSTLPPAPNITQGQNPTYNYTPTFAWEAVAGVTGYDLVIRNLADGSTIIAERNITSTSWTPPTSIPDGVYRWWLTAISADNIRGVWTDPHDFTLRTVVTGLRVTSDSTTLRPVLQWNALPGAVKYDVWIDNLTTGQSQFVRDENVLTNSFSPATGLPYGRYRAWVRGLDAAGEASNWSTSVDLSVILPAPVITQGLNPTFDRTPTFAWTSVEGAAVYDVYLLNLTDYVTTIVERNIPGTSWTPTTPIADGPWRWWVCAISANNIRGEWTDGGYLDDGIDIYVGGRTEVLTPAGTTSDTTPTFSWNPVDGAGRYDLWVDRVDGASQVIREQNLTTNTFTSTALAAGRYRTWVRAISTTGELAPWSEYREFIIVDATDAQDSPFAHPNSFVVLNRFLVSPMQVNNVTEMAQGAVRDRREAFVRTEPQLTEQPVARADNPLSEGRSTDPAMPLIDLPEEWRDKFIEEWLTNPFCES